MADNSSITFTIIASNHANVRGRAVRRVFLSDHALKLAKLFAGDVVVLTAASDIHQEQVGVSLKSRMRRREILLHFHLETHRRRHGMAVIRFGERW